MLLKKASILQLKLNSKKIDCKTFIVSNTNVIIELFKLCTYQIPSLQNILNKTISEKKLIWQAIIITLIMSSLSPSIIGKFCWESIHTIKFLMEKIIKDKIDDLKELSENMVFIFLFFKLL